MEAAAESRYAQRREKGHVREHDVCQEIVVVGYLCPALIAVWNTMARPTLRKESVVLIVRSTKIVLVRVQ